MQRHNDSQGKKLKTVEKEANVAHKPNSRADLSKKRNYWQPVNGAREIMQPARETRVEPIQEAEPIPSQQLYVQS